MLGVRLFEMIKFKAHGGYKEFEIYLFAVQVQILASNLQLQYLHLVVPLLYNRGVPHWSPIQSWFDPSHDLRQKI